jgi:isoquinoline 1-oxidoreductase beta subunit
MWVSRRTFATGAAIGGGLLVAWWLLPRSYPNPLEPAQNEHAFDAWLKISEDGVVTVAVPQLEMGQGVTTLLPQIVAQELGADWRQIAVEPAAISGAYANLPLARRWAHLWDPVGTGWSETSDALLVHRFATRNRFSATAEGTSQLAFEGPSRLAAAAARAMLAQEAAARWGVGWEQCEVAGGLVKLGDKSASFGELAAGAAERAPPDPPPLRTEPPGEEVLGIEGETRLSFPRIDLPSKVDGTFQFAGDVRLPGMVFASIRHGPVDGSQLKQFNAAAANDLRGLKTVIKSKRWLAAVATTWWTAERALIAMAPRFTTAKPVDSDDLAGRLDTMVRGGPSFTVAETGFGAAAMSRVDIARRYEIEPGIAGSIETATATARYADGRLELWMASQAPEQARIAAARAIGLSVEDVVLFPMPAGGSFDARLEHDHAIEIAQIARELDVPVQLSWSRRDEMIRTRPRNPAYILVGAQVSETTPGAIDAMRVRIACPPATVEFGRRLFGNLTSEAARANSAGAKDPMACEGAVPPYELPSVVVEHVPVEIGMPVGRVRGNAHTYTCFAVESFLDEVARANDLEPLSYRMGLLGKDVRLAACLQRAAQLAEWDGGVDQSGQGLACHRIGDAASGGRIACVATARPSEGGVRVTRLSVAVDIGRVVNLDLARQQIEGGLVFGIGTALGNAVRYRAGLPTNTAYAQLGFPALADCPEILVAFMPSEAPSADPGELGAVVASPAIANALFSASGLRLRRLPLLSGGI